jgi:hypothetical protein
MITLSIVERELDASTIRPTHTQIPLVSIPSFVGTYYVCDRDGDCIELHDVDDPSCERAVLEYHVRSNQSASRKRHTSIEEDEDEKDIEIQSSTSRRKISSDCDEKMMRKEGVEEARDDEKLLKSVLEGAICPICLDILAFPMVLSCSHTYCEKCITTWMESHKVCLQGSLPIHSCGYTCFSEFIIWKLFVVDLS